jgi:hypothetical protein
MQKAQYSSLREVEGIQDYPVVFVMMVQKVEFSAVETLMDMFWGSRTEWHLSVFGTNKTNKNCQTSHSINLPKLGGIALISP